MQGLEYIDNFIEELFKEHEYPEELIGNIGSIAFQEFKAGFTIEDIKADVHHVLQIVMRYKGLEFKASKVLDDSMAEYLKRFEKPGRGFRLGSLARLNEQDQKIYMERGAVTFKGFEHRVEEHFLGILTQSDSRLNHPSSYGSHNRAGKGTRGRI